MIVITDAGNARFKVIQFDLSSRRNPRQAPIVLREELFLVTKQVLTDSSPVLRKRFESHPSSDVASPALRTEEDSISSMEIWLRVLHKTVIPDTYKVAIYEMWYLAAASENYQFDIKRLKTWFEEWYIQQKVDPYSFRQLLFPCWTFDHARGFLNATREAVYDSVGYIKEESPVKYSLPRFHLPYVVIQNLVSAKKSLRDNLEAALWEPIAQLLRAKCSCKVDTQYGYIHALEGTGGWPFHHLWPRASVTDILNRLSRFSYQAAPNACKRCRKNYEAIVESAVRTARCDFDGLCLDCMERSKPRPETDAEDYLKDNMPTVDDWSRPCRVQHGEPTWYHSFMGQREYRNVLLKNLRGRYPSRMR
ncbi:MAG: hypothetical protein HETSPECPRED_008905 [Heterodermia speciosa]|uniref:BTB domain-containing protein n=1 Tax=Heterodermia speciosa TaxID=116794 RepID=A0A8H3EMA5_9LECA|nr:MAG: hypothetical protein HETSPECPRED_008905 [Heterodermia speciosa]